ncbi:putative reverse transcriptase domain-containing protein [Tanacetum coccineum]
MTNRDAKDCQGGNKGRDKVGRQGGEERGTILVCYLAGSGDRATKERFAPLVLFRTNGVKFKRVRDNGIVNRGVIKVVMGLADYYRRFIENFPKIAKPLTLLTQKNKTYVWGDKQDEAFQILKEKLCNAPVLALPRWTDDFVVFCVHQKQGFGRAMMQRAKC